MARPYWGHMAGLFVLGLLSTPIALIKPVALKFLIDSGFGNQPVPSFVRFFFPSGFNFSFTAVALISAGMVVLIALVENTYNIIMGFLNTYTSEKLTLNFRTILFNHIQRLSLAYHDMMGSSDALYRMQYDVTKFKSFLMGNLSPMIISVVTLVSMLIVMFYINWQFALIAVCIMLPLWILSKISRTKLKKQWKTVRKEESRAMSVVHEVLSSLRVVKAFGQEDRENERFAERATNAMTGHFRVTLFGSVFSFSVGMILALGTALFFFFGAQSVHEGNMTLGELTMVIAYLAQVFGPLQSISRNINDLQSSLVSIERVLDLLDHEVEVKELPYAAPLKHARGDFEFRDVSFFYRPDRNVLDHVSFKINAGDRVGIKGSTGAGKSTLINLLYRFYDPSTGVIAIDSGDIRKFKLADYRSQFSIVLQEPVLFSTSIEENIRYGRPDASREDIIEAAKAANAHDFIMRAKDGYETLVGERGMQLSGGERQRISIARAFIRSAPVLILDEPTSAVDVNTEGLIIEAMERLMSGKTTFMITHRLDTLSYCNVILHMENGKVVDVLRKENSSSSDRKTVHLT